MDDAQIKTFGEQSYSKAEELDLPPPSQRVLLILKVLPGLIIKSLIVLVLPFYFLLLHIFHLFVPKTLKDIRGQLAAVGSIHCFECQTDI